VSTAKANLIRRGDAWQNCIMRYNLLQAHAASDSGPRQVKGTSDVAGTRHHQVDRPPWADVLRWVGPGHVLGLIGGLYLGASLGSSMDDRIRSWLLEAAGTDRPVFLYVMILLAIPLTILLCVESIASRLEGKRPRLIDVLKDVPWTFADRLVAFAAIIMFFVFLTWAIVRYYA
jgi:hypothetical protein